MRRAPALHVNVCTIGGTLSAEDRAFVLRAVNHIEASERQRRAMQDPADNLGVALAALLIVGAAFSAAIYAAWKLAGVWP